MSCWYPNCVNLYRYLELMRLACHSPGASSKFWYHAFLISRLFREMASSGFEVESGTIHKPRDIENFCIDGFNKTFLVSKCACTPSFYLSVCILQYWFRYGKLIKPFLFPCVSHVFVQKVWFIYIENITSYVLTSNKWALRTVHISIGVSGGV